jgi:hypothetical protein
LLATMTVSWHQWMDLDSFTQNDSVYASKTWRGITRSIQSYSRSDNDKSKEPFFQSNWR